MLFEPFALGPLTLANRIVMAPLTRSRATSKGVPREMFADYYAQRASAGLVIAEATNVSAEGKAYAWTPGIHTADHVAAWAKVTDAVHAKGGVIFLQLIHGGRISHPDLQEDGRQPVAPSAVRADAQTYTAQGKVDVPEPRALDAGEMPRIVEEFRSAAAKAKEAGFDGVEIHSANGYLLDQFLRDGTNRRTDEWGGGVENRLRLPLAVADAIVEVWGPERVGVRISPVSSQADMHDGDPEALFSSYAQALGRRGIGYLHIVEGLIFDDREKTSFDTDVLKAAFGGTVIGNNRYDLGLARDRVRDGRVDLVAFGRSFISNPDLVERLRAGAPLAEWDEATFYGGGREGYTDYPNVYGSAAA